MRQERPVLIHIHICAIWSGSTSFAFRFIRLFLIKKWTVLIQIRRHGNASWSGSTLISHGIKGISMEWRVHIFKMKVIKIPAIWLLSQSIHKSCMIITFTWFFHPNNPASLQKQNTDPHVTYARRVDVPGIFNMWISILFLERRRIIWMGESGEGNYHATFMYTVHLMPITHVLSFKSISSQL
jgi:hypothetical protein